ncbi:MAG TPA: VCBS repeat-containing protein [Lunatimonas sp.]|nr:VCBS repeat-containing protein [Lunatimonas sp.]
MKCVIAFLLVIICFGSGTAQELFESQAPRKSGVRFQNALKEDNINNILRYEYFYNGGGVAVGDINNDGLDDIYFTGNMVSNKLYLNQGDFKFKDITKEAGVSGKNTWTTGVTMVDVNGDGLLDIYVCYSGKGDPAERKNQLFINQGDETFIDEAAAFGLDDPSNSIQALFFDFDRDGDLDMYLVNHNTAVINEMDFDAKRTDRNKNAGDKLYRNDNGIFVDVSQEAGIKGSSMGFGLGVAVSDINGNGFPDLYISNDYIEPDYLYINNGDGTFTESLADHLLHISYFSMGSDISDINNDGLPDIFTLDMLPEDNKRQKLLYGPENYEQYALMVMKDFYHQQMRNMLHLNQGNGLFAETGQLAGISNSDWSWAALFADLDNDGWKDLFVTNGYFRDYTNRDFLKYKGDYYFEKARAKEVADTLHLVTSMISTPTHNYLYQNNGDLTFSDKSKEWGMGTAGFSNGAAFADLDNDGTLDLIVNHLNAAAGIYKNTLNEIRGVTKFLQIQLEGEGKNRFGIGAKVICYTSSGIQFLEQQPTRGFQSSVSQRLHVGLGEVSMVDSLTIWWPSGKQQTIYEVKANSQLALKESHAQHTDSPFFVGPELEPLFTQIVPPVQYEHEETGYNDFKRQPLLNYMYSPTGPVLASGDVNKSGVPALFVGGTQGKPGELFFQASTGQFFKAQGLDLSADSDFTDADAVFFDATGNGWQDLYIVSGGYHDYEKDDERLQDRLYLNQGGGNFKKATNNLPPMTTSGSCVRPVDINRDGFMDLFVGGRVIPGEFPEPPNSYILINDGTGKFTDMTSFFSSDLENLGMVTDAQWVDLNADGFLDLVVVGEFMPIEVFINEGGKGLRKATEEFFEKPLYGLWSKLAVGDFDMDGDLDFIVGNFGLNTQLKASDAEPLTLVYDDFDKNGSVDPIMNLYIQGESYPFMSRDELLDQMYGMRSKFTTYESFANAKLTDLFTKQQLQNAQQLQVTTLNTVYLENKDGKLVPQELPMEAQFAPIYAITVLDYTKDGNLDFILAGNQNATRLRLGLIDANFGQVYAGDGKGEFRYVPQKESGLRFLGDVKSMLPIKMAHLDILMVGINNQGVESYLLNSSKVAKKFNNLSNSNNP